MSEIPTSVTMLGTKGGPAIRPGSARPTSTLIEMGGQTMLVDAGLGAAIGMAEAGVTLTDLDAVFITHLHSDHYLELGPLLHTAWTAGLRHQIPIFGPPGIEHYWQFFLNAMAYDIALRTEDEGRPDFHDLCVVSHISDERTIDMQGVLVSAMRNDHPPIEDSFALRFEATGQTIVLSGDTAPMPAMAEFAQGADLLVHEAMLRDGVQDLVDRMGYADDRLMAHILRSHSPAEDVARIAQAAQVRALALNHLIPSGEPGVTEETWRAAVSGLYDGPVHIGHDGLVIEVGEQP